LTFEGLGFRKLPHDNLMAFIGFLSEELKDDAKSCESQDLGDRLVMTNVPLWHKTDVHSFFLVQLFVFFRQCVYSDSVYNNIRTLPLIITHNRTGNMKKYRYGV